MFLGLSKNNLRRLFGKRWKYYTCMWIKFKKNFHVWLPKKVFSNKTMKYSSNWQSWRRWDFNSLSTSSLPTLTFYIWLHHPTSCWKKIWREKDLIQTGCSSESESVLYRLPPILLFERDEQFTAVLNEHTLKN